MCSVNASSASGSNSAVAKFSMQQETEAAPFKYAGASSVSHEVRISKQLNTNTTSFLAEGTPINLVNNLLSRTSYHLSRTIIVLTGKFDLSGRICPKKEKK